jgi:hypothetical protein
LLYSIFYLRYIKVVYSCVIVLMSIKLIWSNYDQPIIDFSDILRGNNVAEVAEMGTQKNLNIFFPLNFFLSFPNLDRINSLGVTFWLFILNRILDIGSNKFNILAVGKEEELIQ